MIAQPVRSHLGLPRATFARLSLAVSAVAGLWCAPIVAQTVEQTIALQPGWNAFSIDVGLDISEPDSVLAGVPYRSIWTYLSPTGTTEGRWLTHHAEGPEFLNSLFAIAGGRSYLLESRSAGVLRLTGRPVRRAMALRAGIPSLYSAVVDPSSPPTFAEHFVAPSLRSGIEAIYELIDGATYTEVSFDSTARGGAAYWVFSDQSTPDADPIRISNNSLRFGPETSTQRLEIEVSPADTRRAFTIDAIAGLQSGSGGGDPTWLELQRSDGTFERLSGGVTVEVAANQSVLQLSIRAAADRLETDSNDRSLEEAVIRLTSEEGSRALVGAVLALPTVEGVWVGEALLGEVESAAAHGAEFAPTDTFPLSLILEVSEDGVARLVDEVDVRVEPSASSETRRFRALGFHEAVPLSGTLAPDGNSGSVSGAVVLESDHPLNPYRHRYHPEHRDGVRVERRVTLRLLPDDPDPLRSAFSINSVARLTGIYEEEITGLSLQPIRLRGAFRLVRLGDLER